ncbi:hypothetical protein CNECB9_220013 [Cupriavidus necator]|uniref:Uncharacterized protein n=1 Tax=Cupriavidus necator TaxID=106590 RepID=A0A1K0ICX8_CUPNE|nr:hypothetical protein CNECB9_220013 [Cupriavidus necator]
MGQQNGPSRPVFLCGVWHNHSPVFANPPDAETKKPATGTGAGFFSNKSGDAARRPQGPVETRFEQAGRRA